MSTAAVNRYPVAHGATARALPGIRPGTGPPGSHALLCRWSAPHPASAARRSSSSASASWRLPSWPCWS